MKNIDSHLQPKFFLKGFLAAKEQPCHADSIFVYKKGMPFKIDGTRKENNPARTGIDNTAFVTNFYAFLKEDGTLDPETYETRLVKDIENPGNFVLRKLRGINLPKSGIIKMNDFLSAGERKDFARYVGCMFGRTKRSRRDHSKAVQKTVENSKKIGFSFAEIMSSPIPEEEKKKLERYVRSVEPGFDNSTGRITIPPKYLDNFKNEMETNESFPKSIFRAVDLVEPIIMKMKWQIRITTTPHSFFTGDDPVTWNNLKDPNATLMFPISSNAVFFGFNDQNVSETIYLEKDHKVVTYIRTIFAEKCQEIYYSKRSKWLVTFINRR